MGWQYTPYSLFIGLAAVVSAVMAVYVLGVTGRDDRDAVIYSLLVMLIGASGWSLTALYGLSQTGLGPKLLAERLVFLTADLVIFGWFVFTFAYTGRGWWRRPAVLGPVAGTLGLDALLGLTNPYHGLFWTTATVRDTGSFLVLSVAETPLYFLFVGFSYLIIGAGVFLLIRFVHRSQDLFRGQTLALVGGILVPTALHAVAQIGLPVHPDVGLTPISFTVTGALLVFAITRYRLLDIKPVARQRAVERMQDGYIVLDGDDRIVDMNPAAAGFFDFDRDGAIGDPLLDLVPEAQPLVNGAQTCELTLTRNGTTQYVDAHCSPLAENKPSHERLITLHDVTQEREHKRELEQSRQLLDSTQQLADVGGWQVDVETERVRLTDETRRILDVPPAQTSPGLAETIEYFHPDDRETVETAIENCITAGSPFDIEVRAGIEGEKPVWVQVQGHPVYDEANEQIIRIQGAIQDITERYERERQLEQQNERLDQFASLISHDLRNPLNAAKMRFGHIRETVPEEHAERVQQNLDRMEAMIDDLLALARTGQRVEETTEVTLAEVATDAWEHADVTDCEFFCTIPEPTTLEADRDRLLHVFENLYRNAADHNDPPVTIRVGLLGDQGLPTDGGQQSGFYIEDDGSGIPPVEQDDIFKHGYTTDEDGTGFGLSIVQTMVEAHDWELRVTDGTDGGARFEITSVDTKH